MWLLDVKTHLTFFSIWSLSLVTSYSLFIRAWYIYIPFKVNSNNQLFKPAARAVSFDFRMQNLLAKIEIV